MPVASMSRSRWTSGFLVVGRDASVAQGVAHAGRRHRLNIVRFQDGFHVHTLSSLQGV